MRRKIINCINNCENILSGRLLLPARPRNQLFPEQFGRFSATLSLLPSINKRKHVFSSAENFLLLAKRTRVAKRPRSQEFAGSQAERNIFRIHLCAFRSLWLSATIKSSAACKPLLSVMSICCLIVAGLRAISTDLWR